MQVDNRVKFYLSAAAGALGILVTLVFVPDVTTLDLAEADVRWDALSAGSYHMPASSCPRPEALVGTCLGCHSRRGFVVWTWD